MTSIDRAEGVDRVDRAPIVQRSRVRSARQQQAIVDAALRLVEVKGGSFTTQELIAEAGIALQTFYRYFAGKDELLLAAFEDLIGQSAVLLEEQARDIDDPAARLQFYVTWMLRSVGPRDDGGPAQFVTSEHWRLHQMFPDDVARITQPITDLFERELRLATDQGRLHSEDPARDAWFTMRLVMSVFHHYAYVTTDEHLATVADDLWAFCLAAYHGDRGSG